MEHHEVLIVGGGNAGISLAARLLRDGASDVAVVAPQPVHRYRPLLNYVSAGEASMADLDRPMQDVLPAGCRWIQDSVVAVDPAVSTVRTRAGRTLRWSTLVLCPGMVEDWAATPGLQAAYLDGWAVSSYVPSAAPQVWPRLTALRSGSVLFSVPPEPAPCAPTALKPLLMACDHWQRAGVLADIDVRLVLPEATATGLPAADERLESILASYGVEVLREARITEVDPDGRAVTVATPTGPRVLGDLDVAHAVPHYRAPQWIAGSGLAADQAPGLVDIDPGTLRHRRHASIWALGDAADLRTRSSGGGLRRQVDILAKNIAAAARRQAVADLRRLHRHADHHRPPDADAGRGGPQHAAHPVGAAVRPGQAPSRAVVLRPVRPAADLLAADPAREGLSASSAAPGRAEGAGQLGAGPLAGGRCAAAQGSAPDPQAGARQPPDGHQRGGDGQGAGIGVTGQAQQPRRQQQVQEHPQGQRGPGRAHQDQRASQQGGPAEQHGDLGQHGHR